MSASPFLPLMREGLDPVAELSRRRIEEPVSQFNLFGMKFWLLTRYDDVRQVLGSATDFSTDFSTLADAAIGVEALAGQQDPGGLGMSDPPKHTRLRKILTPEFTMRRLARLAPRIDAIVADCLEAIGTSDKPVDLLATFALPIPSLVICELLGVPYGDRDDFQQLSNSRFDFMGDAETLDSVAQSLAYMRELVAGQRAEPGDGLLGMIVREHADAISDEELAGLADGLLVGGHETTASMLALGALMLLRSPEHFALVRDDDTAITPMVEEMLRYLTVVQVAFPRFAKQPVVLPTGQEISVGDIVIASLSSANRDERLSEGLEAFDPTRAPESHFAFGHGIHRCIGAELARMELRAAYPALVRRFPNLRLAVSPDQIEFRELSVVYGVQSLPVTW
ncbi:MAG: cytochrome P450 [Geodermatophilaceae bacterium]|nr:cytochrome P450 [Geodermatophilaceae bacterium]